MIDIGLVFKTLAILALGVISPGPDFFMVLRNSLMYGRKAGFFSALGIATGCVASFILLMLGLKIVLNYKLIQLLLRIVCGFYLIYLGYKSFVSQSQHHKMQYQHKPSEPMFVYFKNGLLTNILNPKLYTISGAILIFAEQQKPSLATSAGIVLGNALVALIWFSSTCFLFSHPKTQLMYFKKETVINRILGCVLMLVGIRIFWG